MIVLDTNVLSELMRPEPADSVFGWVATHPAQTLFTTSIAKAEILHGVALLPSGKRREALEQAAEEVFMTEFAGRVLAFGADAARPYARIAVQRRLAGRPISHFDAQIAAIAHCFRAAIATRNVADFEGLGIEILNPWDL